jgi:hypothetical protein
MRELMKMNLYNYFFSDNVINHYSFSILFCPAKKNIPVELFVEAIRNENNGHFEQAVITYETTLDKVNKIRFHCTLKNKIIEKLKLLQTIFEYNNNLHFVR